MIKIVITLISNKCMTVRIISNGFYVWILLLYEYKMKENNESEINKRMNEISKK